MTIVNKLSMKKTQSCQMNAEMAISRGSINNTSRMGNQLDPRARDKLRKRMHLEKLEQEIEARRARELSDCMEAPTETSFQLRQYTNPLCAGSTMEHPQHVEEIQQDVQELRFQITQEFGSHQATSTGGPSKRDTPHMPEKMHSNTPLTLLHHDSNYIRNVPSDKLVLDLQGYSLHEKINGQCNSILDNPDMWQPLTIIVIPDVFLDPSCYTTFNSLPRRLRDNTQLRIITLPTYSRYETSGSKLGFTEDIQEVRRVIQEQLDHYGRDVILIGHGYGTLVGSSACRGMIRIPKLHSSGYSRRIPSVQGIISIAGWVMGQGKSIILAGPREIFDFRLRKCIRVAGNDCLLKVESESKKVLFTPPNGHGFGGYIGHSWEAVFEAKPKYLPWDEIPSWHLILEKDYLLPMSWQLESIKQVKRAGLTVLKGLEHGPFHSAWQELADHLISETGPIKTIRTSHEELIWNRRMAPLNPKYYYERLVSSSRTQ